MNGLESTVGSGPNSGFLPSPDIRAAALGIQNRHIKHILFFQTGWVRIESKGRKNTSDFSATSSEAEMRVSRGWSQRTAGRALPVHAADLGSIPSTYWSPEPIRRIPSAETGESQDTARCGRKTETKREISRGGKSGCTYHKHSNRQDENSEVILGRRLANWLKNKELGVRPPQRWILPLTRPHVLGASNSALRGPHL